MKKLIVMAVMLSTAAVAGAQGRTHVGGYTRSNGTYVQPHDRTTRDATRNDNWTTRGNVNPDNGRIGTRARDGETSYRPYRSRRSR